MDGQSKGVHFIMKIHYGLNGWQYWYDPTTRCWWAAIYDPYGNQQGAAIHAYTRSEIEADTLKAGQ
jgi:hypothetical protein